MEFSPISSKAILAAIEKQEGVVNGLSSDIGSFAQASGHVLEAYPEADTVLKDKTKMANIEQLKLNALRERLHNPSLLTKVVDVFVR